MPRVDGVTKSFFIALDYDAARYGNNAAGK
jgi:hypothetical protein